MKKLPKSLLAGLTLSEETGPIPACNFYLPESMSRNDPVYEPSISRYIEFCFFTFWKKRQGNREIAAWWAAPGGGEGCERMVTNFATDRHAGTNIKRS